MTELLFFVLFLGFLLPLNALRVTLLVLFKALKFERLSHLWTVWFRCRSEMAGSTVGSWLGDGLVVSKFSFWTTGFVSYPVAFCSLGMSLWFDEKRPSCCLEKDELEFSQEVGSSHGCWLGVRSWVCDWVKCTFCDGNSIIVLLALLPELVVDKNDILCPSGGGDCAGSRAGGVKFWFRKTW